MMNLPVKTQFIIVHFGELELKLDEKTSALPFQDFRASAIESFRQYHTKSFSVRS